ncbi:MAG: DNA mismatch repair protein MutS [Lachnospiraceae bacterium]|nr:DNA mismatch repair protein MutS [Ruminococcus sp.]MCM1274711.1 DNA mismatch repair protein MutS [Lachnospiraceae bacterium]
MSESEKQSEKISPMLKQYLEIKSRYGDYILFFRLGDFYEMFFEDATTVSRELELTLTARAGSPMCGVPFHSSEQYIKRLIDRGFKVAICEQLTDPHASKGLVERGVIRLVTAGTVTEASMLTEDSNNYITSVYAEKTAAGLVFADISTGEVHVFEKSGKNLEQEMIAELSRFAPVELLINNGFLDLKEVHSFVKDRLKGCVCEMPDEQTFDNSDLSVITAQFENKSDVGQLGISSMPLVQKALCALFRYVGEAQKATVKRFVELTAHSGSEYMDLGLAARRNLEITETMRTKEKRGSLLWVLDKTVTAMGRRRLRAWTERPLVSHTAILSRLNAVEELMQSSAVLSDIRAALKGVFDLERLMSRVMYKSASPRDIYALGQTCARLPLLKKELSALKSKLLVELYGSIDELSEIAQLVENAIVDEPPINIKDGGVIKSGFNEEIDRLRDVTGGGEDILRQMEQREREATGIRTLKVGCNRVFGYYIEVSKSFVGQVPAHYHRKQTLTNGERYITDELKKVEGEILGANDRILALEQAVFGEIRGFIATKLEQIQKTAAAVSETDVLCSFAQVSLENSYVKPEITIDSVIDIKDGRHPVVEQILLDHPFTPNDVYLDKSDNRLLVITGPNMSGKSTFMRQTALIVLMAQIGCFVPARYAKIGVVDRIFTRVGASDDLTAGQSTFMVEMNEVADILQNATKSSLVILDEIGRGTSTFDGISIAKSVAEHISQKIGCKTLFATHYHELITMEKDYKGVKNFSVAVSKRGDDIKFLHKIVPGGTDDSYGIEVAKLAGLPNKVIQRAKEELKDLEVSGKVRLAEAIERSRDEQFSFAAVNEQNAIARLRAADINTMSPMDALMFIKELKDSLN